MYPQGATLALVFKIVAEDAWHLALAAGQFSGSADDVRDGFIHLSTAKQLDQTLSRHFKGQRGLLAVAYDADALSPHLRWEMSRSGELYPHLYAPLPTGAALWQRAVPIGPNGEPAIEDDWRRC